MLVVRHKDEGDANSALHILELHLHVLTELAVKSAQRLVQQQHPRAVDERSRQRDTLPLPAAELGRLSRLEPTEPHGVQRTRDADRSLVTSHAPHPQAVADVFTNRHVRKEGIVLEDRVDIAIERGYARDVSTVQENTAGGGPFEAGDEAERRGLA